MESVSIIIITTISISIVMIAFVLMLHVHKMRSLPRLTRVSEEVDKLTTSLTRTICDPDRGEEEDFDDFCI